MVTCRAAFVSMGLACCASVVMALAPFGAQTPPGRRTADDYSNYRRFTGATDTTYSVPAQADCSALAGQVVNVPGVSFDLPRLHGKPMPKPAVHSTEATTIGAAADFFVNRGLVAGTPFEALMIAAVDVQSQGQNIYVRLTNEPPGDGDARSYMGRLEDSIRASRVELTPADVMARAMNVANGNYPLAVLTAHNLLKDVAYQGRQERRKLDVRVRQNKDLAFPARLGDIASKLVNLRSLGDASQSDKMGIWYHLFVPLAITAWTGTPDQADIAIQQEYTVREVTNHLPGLINMGSRPDPAKKASDLCFAAAARAIHGRAREMAEARERSAVGQSGPGAGQATDLPGRLSAEEASVALEVSGIRQRRDQDLADLRATSEKERSLAEALNVRLLRFLRVLDELRRTAVPACDTLANGSGPTPADVANADREEDRLESLLYSAIDLARPCPSADALANARKAYQEAQASAAEVEKLTTSRTIDERAVKDAGPIVVTTRPQVAEAINLFQSLREERLNGQDLVTDYYRMREGLKSLNQSLNDDIASLKARHAQFLAQFTGELLSMLRASSGRLQKLQDSIDELDPIDEASLAPLDRVNSEMAAVLLRLESRLNVDVERTIQELADCQQRTGGASSALADQLDTTRVIARLAFEKLGREYVRAHAACATKFPGARSGGASAAKPEANARLRAPAYLFHVVREEPEREFNVSLFVSLPKKDAEGFFLLGDGYGGVYHVVGEVLGTLS